MSPKDLAQTASNLRAMLDGTYASPPELTANLHGADLFIGISRVRLAREGYRITDGYELQSTYAHTFAAPLVAFAPPRAPGAAHPPPWHYLRNAGTAETVLVQLYIRSDAPALTGDRLESARTILSLLRLLVGAPVLAPVLCGIRFESVGAERPVLWGFEPVFNWPSLEVELTASRLEELSSLLVSACKLMLDDDFSRAFSLIDAMWWLPTLSAQMIAIWTVAETLMRPGRRDTTKALANAIRNYVAFDRSEGDRLYQSIVRLYGTRGSAAHASVAVNACDVSESYDIVRRILLRSIAEGERPPRPEGIRKLWSIED